MPSLPHQQLPPHHHHHQPYPPPAQRSGMPAPAAPPPPLTGRDSPYYGHHHSHVQHSHGDPMGLKKHPSHSPYNHHHPSSSYHSQQQHHQQNQHQIHLQQHPQQQPRHARTLSSSSSSSSTAPFYHSQPSPSLSHPHARQHHPGTHSRHQHARHPSSSSLSSLSHSQEHPGHHRSNSSSFTPPQPTQHSMSQQQQQQQQQYHVSRSVYHNQYSGHPYDHSQHSAMYRPVYHPQYHSSHPHQRQPSFHAQDAVVPQQLPSRMHPIREPSEAAATAAPTPRAMEVDDEEDEEDDGEIIPSTKVSKDMKDTTKGKQGSPSAAENKSQRSGSISEDGQEIHKCANCGKVYKHPNCLAKHRWEHSKYWKSATKFYLSKHQQVRMMEAAAILLGLDSMRNRDDDEIVSAIIHGRVQSTTSVTNSSRSPPPRSLSRAGYHDDAMVMDKGIKLGERKASSPTKTELMSESETTVVPKKEEQPSVAVGTDTQSAAAPLSISPQSQSDVSMSGSPPSLVPDDRSSTTSSMSSNSSHDIDTPMLEVKRAGTNGAIDGKTYSSSESAREAPLIGESGHYQHRHLPSREPYAYGRVPPINSQHDPRYANPPQEDYSTLPQHSSPADVAVARKPMVSPQQLY